MKPYLRWRIFTQFTAQLSEYQWFWCLGTSVSLKANRLTLKRYISFISIASVTYQGPENIITHYCDVIKGAITSQITSRTIVYSTFYSDADQGKHQSSASLAFVRRIHRWPVISPHKGPVTRKMLPFDDVIMFYQHNSEPEALSVLIHRVARGHHTLILHSVRYAVSLVWCQYTILQGMQMSIYISENNDVTVPTYCIREIIADLTVGLLLRDRKIKVT